MSPFNVIVPAVAAIAGFILARRSFRSSKRGALVVAVCCAAITLWALHPQAPWRFLLG